MTDPPSKKSASTHHGQYAGSTQRLWQLSGMGMEFAGSAIGMGLIGWLIDWAAGTEPWFMVSLGVLGVIGGMYLLIREAIEAQQQAGQAYRRSHEQSTRDR